MHSNLQDNPLEWKLTFARAHITSRRTVRSHIMHTSLMRSTMGFWIIWCQKTPMHILFSNKIYSNKITWDLVWWTGTSLSYSEEFKTNGLTQVLLSHQVTLGVHCSALVNNIWRSNFLRIENLTWPSIRKVTDLLEFSSYAKDLTLV